MYEIRVLQRFWYHASTLIIVALIANWFIFTAATSAPNLLDGIINSPESRREGFFYGLVCGIGPFINLLIWALAAHFLHEAIDDLDHQSVTSTLTRRNRITRFASALLGALLLPPLLFTYTFHLPNLWGHDPSFWSANGWLTFSALGAILGYVAAVRGYKGENVIDEAFKDIET